jgi:hypothetical protein
MLSPWKQSSIESRSTMGKPWMGDECHVPTAAA